MVDVLERGGSPARSARADAARRALERFRMDAARWVRPEQVADVSEVTVSRAVRLLVDQPSLRAMAWLRLATLSKDLRIRGVSSAIQRRLLRHYGIELVPGAEVGGGLYIAHPVGCVLVAERIGTNVTVIGQATFGTRDDARWPVIGDRVFVGVGARVLGGIEVGDDARIGANAVVLEDVPRGVTVVGIPARPIGERRT